MSEKKEKVPKGLIAATFTTGQEYIDSHVHLDVVLERVNKKPEDLISVIDSGVFGPGFSAAVNICCAPESLIPCDQIVGLHHPKIRFAWGVHPHDAKSFTESLANQIVERVSKPYSVAFGEIGLDYHYNLSPPEIQRDVFSKQLKLAIQIGKPIIIHSREAEEETISIMSQIVPNDYPIHLHCYTSSMESFALRMLDKFQNLKIGLTGCMTFKNAPYLRDLAAKIDLKRLLLETDGPFMAPLPHRGDFAHPGMIPTIAAAIAKVRNQPINEIIQQCTQNTHDLYRF